jgi:NADH:ubiquinone oxidoreductase subunit C
MTRDELKAYIASHFDGVMTLLETGRYDPVYLITVENLHKVALALRDDATLQFDYLCNLGAIDTKQQFEVIYQVASTTKNLRLDFKLTMPYDKAEVVTVVDIWPAANWYEREMWELYGINIKGHDNLTQFLLPDNWDQGHPMRKDWDAPDFIRLPEFGA